MKIKALISNNLLVLLSLSLLTTSCLDNNIKEDKDDVAILRRNIDRVSSMDPIKAESAGANRAVALVYETLLEYDYTARPYKLKPYLLKEFPSLDDSGKTYRCTLRDDIYFGPSKYLGDGEAVTSRAITSEDVIYSFKRLADAKLASPGYWTIKNILGIDAFHQMSTNTDIPTDYSTNIPGLRIIDDKNFEIELVTPSTEFLWILAMPYTAIVPREVAQRFGSSFGTIECGSGPYQLDSWQRNYSMIFKLRPNRSDARDGFTAEEDAPGLKRFDEIHFYVMDDASTRWLSFLSGELDINQEISRDNWDATITPTGELSDELKSHGVRLVSKDSMMVSYIAFNMDDPIVGSTNKLLRQAMTCAFNAEEWIELNKGRVAYADGPVPPNISARLEEPNQLSYNLERAKALLAEAGYKDGIDPATGKPLQLTLDLGRTDQETRESAELIASFMQKIGIDLKLQYNNWPLFLKKISKRESQLFMVAWLADYPDALNFLQLFYSENASPGPNRCNYNNPEYDKIYEAACIERDPQKREEYIQEMQRIVREDAPWIFIHYGRDNILLKAELQNVIPHDFPYGLEKHWRYKK